jgi:hypothetical protein
MPKTFTLTVAQDFINAADGGGDTFLAGLNGIFGNQPTLTAGDTLTDTGGNNNQLDAFFNSHGTHYVVGTTIEGIQTWNFTNFAVGSLVNLFGGVNVGGPDGTHSPGVRTITYQNSFGSLIVGGGAVGIESRISTLTVANNDGFGPGGVYGHVPFVAVKENSSVFKGVTNPTLSVNINSLTNGLGAPYDVGARGFAGDYGIVAGPNTGTTGYQTWNLNVQDSVGDNILLGALSATNATTINIGDASGQTGGLLLDSATANGNSAASWANLRTIDAAGLTGTLVISGAEGSQSGAGAGFLSDLTGAGTFQIIGGGGDGNFVDLTAWTHTAANLFVNLGFGTGNELDLNSNIVDTTVAFGQFTGVAILGDVETAGGSLGGNINMALLPGVSEIILKAANGGVNPTESADFNITNAPNNLTFNFQDTNQNDHNFGIIGVGGPGDTLTVDYGVAGTSFAANSTGVFASQGYDNVDINVTAINDLTFYQGGVIAVANTGDAETLTLNTDVTLEVGHFGAPHVGVSSLTLLGGSILAPTSGTLDLTGTGEVVIGVTDASTINETGGGTLIMDAPGNDITLLNPLTGDPVYTGIDVTSNGVGSVLSGTVGHEHLISTVSPTLDPGAATAFTAIVGNDTLTDTAGGAKFWGDGGADTLNMGGTGNIAFFGEILDGPNGLLSFQNQLITNIDDQAYQGFWGVANGTGPTAIGTSLPGMVSLDGGISAGTEVDNTTVNGFTFSTTNQDVLRFNVDAWAGGNAGSGSLVNGDGQTVVTGPASLQLVTSPVANLLAGTNVVVDGIGGTFANASTLAASLASANGDLVFSKGVLTGTSVHMLVAYETGANTIQVADVDFINNTGATQTNTDAMSHVVVSDMVKLVGAGALNDLVTHSGAIVFDHVA